MATNFDRSVAWTETIDSRYRKAHPPLLITAFASVGIIYGDIGTSPLYVMNGIFPQDGPVPSPEDALGAISAIVWTLTFVPLIKYSIIALEFGTGDGEGGPFALFSQMYPPEKAGSEMALPSIHSIGEHTSTEVSSFLARKYVKSFIRVITLFAVALIISDGILTPAVSVSSAIGGIAIPVPSLKSSDITGISVAILVVLFFSQRFGTNKLGMSFAPIVTVWLLLISGTGIYNITKHPAIFRAFDPSRAILYFVRVKSLHPLSGILLAITGVEALFAKRVFLIPLFLALLGHFTKGSIRLSFITWIYPSLILAYLGQGAQLITNGQQVISNIFYQTIPGPTGGPLWWVVWTFGLLATIVASQAMITASFSLIQQMVGLKSFPPVTIVYTSDHSQGQIYAPVVNFLLLIGTIGVLAGFGAGDALTAAYGFAVAGVLLTTTFLMALVMIYVKKLSVCLAVAFFIVAGFVDAAFFASSLQKIPHGAWFTLSLGCLIGIFLLFWTWAKGLEDKFDSEHRVKLSQLLTRCLPESIESDIGSQKRLMEQFEKMQDTFSANSAEDAEASDSEALKPLRDAQSSRLTIREPEMSAGTSAPLVITDLALHEEPEIIEENLETEKTAFDVALSPEDIESDQTKSLNQPQQKIAISEPRWRKSSHRSASQYPPIQSAHASGILTSSHSNLVARRRSNTLDLNELTINPEFMKGIKLSGPLPRIECFAFFHHLGEGIGAPHSFTALLRHQPSIPRVVVFLSIRVVGVPHLQEEDKFLIDKLRTVTGFYLMTYRVGYRDSLDLRGLAKPTLERIISLERGISLPGSNSLVEENILKIVQASQNTNHILPHYHCTSKKISPNFYFKGLSRVLSATRSFLIEEIYQRVSQNFPETSTYVIDESQVLRIGVNALI
ncbi:potassium transporter-domain-containing protein [Phakopsora pachyrhizi]|uniref:K+ potassium transporter-domain-containing protein n=1 Tax=Phakopsora pachyrhizi TaxID=170000 RepID=A0AAV0BJR3_PHAPC|nr:potassium transporter-domain-containing protein [Phakopsora pachyrhizi]KAI8453439.1 potassium transporter-domain-containing protein [Phakopsora pachyrhizi]CAH7687488.1 K+ potassium transporter-domain-containing protein [Phakopsora pachyrhizi]